MKYDYLIFIGRFQPFHFGHAKVIQTALAHAKHVIVLIGSANRARDWFNPFTVQERDDTIRDWMRDSGIDEKRITLMPLNDHVYDLDGWLVEVQQRVDTIIRTNEKGWSDYPPKVGLIGHAKDHTSYYLGLFPQWGNMDVGAYTDLELFNSTDVRNVYFGDNRLPHGEWEALISGVPNTTHNFLRTFRVSDAYDDLYSGHQYILKYREDHAYRDPKIRYEPSHTCVDACVLQSGHILLIERKAHPGKGLLAMPGGFVNLGERLIDGMIRELREETRLKISERVLRGSITANDVFDDPHRSARGRIFSHTYRIDLEPMPGGLPKVRGGDDARKAKWYPLSELDPLMFFEDHYFIIQNMAGRPRK